MRRDIASIEKSVPEIIERGKEIIFPERHEECERYVNSSVKGIYKGVDAKMTLAVLEELATNKTMDEVLDTLNSDPKTDEYDRVAGPVFEFSSRGQNF